ncbi:MAG: DNA polymerase III subunit beta [Pseudomonadota bacterium]|jgi:DNA polymerase III subunit beta
MKFTIARELLLKPLQLAAGVVERRQTLPVLANVLLNLNDGVLRITGTDLEVEICGTVALSDAMAGGAITIPARKLLDICRSLPEGAEISLVVEADQRVKIQSGRSRFTLAALPAEEFPEVEQEAASIAFRIAQNDLRKALEATAFAMAQQDVRYYLNGMLWEIRPGLLRTVATDGHRLARTDTPIAVSIEDRVQAILPRKAVNELSRLLSDGGEAEVMMGTNHLRVEGDGYRFTAKLVDGAYPDYERVIPAGGSRILEGDREALRQAFSRTAILSNEKYRGVRLELAGGRLRVAANNPEQESAEEEVSVVYDADHLEIGFNVGYLLDVLNALPGTRVRFTLSDANSSVLLADPEQINALYVIMPMRL